MTTVRGSSALSISNFFLILTVLFAFIIFAPSFFGHAVPEAAVDFNSMTLQIHRMFLDGRLFEYNFLEDFLVEEKHWEDEKILDYFDYLSLSLKSVSTCD